MSHVTHANKSCRICEWVMSHSNSATGSAACSAPMFSATCPSPSLKTVILRASISCASSWLLLVCRLKTVRTCYIVLQGVAGCCRVLQYGEVFCSVVHCVAVYCSVLQCVAVCCSVLQYVAVCCSALQCVAVCCSVL